MVLRLHVWGPALGLPSIDAECLAAITYLAYALPAAGKPEQEKQHGSNDKPWGLVATSPSAVPTRKLTITTRTGPPSSRTPYQSRARFTGAKRRHSAEPAVLSLSASQLPSHHIHRCHSSLVVYPPWSRPSQSNQRIGRYPQQSRLSLGPSPPWLCSNLSPTLFLISPACPRLDTFFFVNIELFDH